MRDIRFNFVKGVSIALGTLRILCPELLWVINRTFSILFFFSIPRRRVEFEVECAPPTDGMGLKVYKYVNARRQLYSQRIEDKQVPSWQWVEFAEVVPQPLIKPKSTELGAVFPWKARAAAGTLTNNFHWLYRFFSLSSTTIIRFYCSNVDNWRFHNSCTYYLEFSQ